jgi:phosphate transport system regulatory protein PhoU
VLDALDAPAVRRWSILAADAMDAHRAEIDELNIHRASLEAMRRAVMAIAPLPDMIIVDAFRIPDLRIAQCGVPKGDRKCSAIAAASIVAKVTRDREMLALHQPVAADLRYIITVLKVNNDLERIGDHAVAIAERAVVLAGLEPVPRPEDFDLLVQTVQRMMKESLTALIEHDAALARSVCEMDDEVDRVHRLMYSAMQTVMRNDVALIESAVNTISATRHLERIGDLATNIAEEVVFIAEARVIKHHAEEEEKEMFPRARKLMDRERLIELGEQLAKARETARTSFLERVAGMLRP